MFDEKKVKELILTSLVTDAYCLGSHWVYDEKQLKENDLNWNELNNPLSVWHKEKSLGDFTHYGDQTYWLYEFLQNKETFDEKEYLKFWEEKIKSYNGYIDGATRETLENIKNGVSPSASNSSDLSIVGRITPLLLVYLFLLALLVYNMIHHNKINLLYCTTLLVYFYKIPLLQVHLYFLSYHHYI